MKVVFRFTDIIVSVGIRPSEVCGRNPAWDPVFRPDGGWRLSVDLSF